MSRVEFDDDTAPGIADRDALLESHDCVSLGAPRGNAAEHTCVYATIDTTCDEANLTVAYGGHPLAVHVGPHGSSNIGVPGALLGPFARTRTDAP